MEGHTPTVLHVILKALILLYSSKITHFKGVNNDVATKFVSGRDAYSSYETIYGLSKLKRVDRCLRDFPSGRCKVAGYNKIFPAEDVK